MEFVIFKVKLKSGHFFFMQHLHCNFWWIDKTETLHIPYILIHLGISFYEWSFNSVQTVICNVEIYRTHCILCFCGWRSIFSKKLKKWIYQSKLGWYMKNSRFLGSICASLKASNLGGGWLKKVLRSWLNLFWGKDFKHFFLKFSLLFPRK